MPAVTSTGIGSGVDVESIVSALVNAERVPAESRLDIREAETTVTLSALGSLKGALSQIRDGLAPLTRASTFDRYVATPSDETAFTATAVGVNAASQHQVKVNQLAQTQRLTTQADFTSATAIVGTGTLTISDGSGGALSIEIDATNHNLTEIRDAINNAAGNGFVSASIINGDTGSKLVLQPREAGTANALSVTVSDNDGDDSDANGLSRLAMAQLTEVAAQDAEVEIDGQTITASSNRLENAIEGVTINLLKADPAETHTLNIAKDRSGIESAVADFVSGFNDALASINRLSVGEEGEDGKTQPGVLQGDFMLRSVVGQIRRVMSESVSGAGSGYQNLSAIGIEVQRDGTLSLNAAQLSQAMNDGADFQALLTGDNGIASRLDTILKGYTSAGGLIGNRQTSLTTQLTRIDSERDLLDKRMETLEQRTYKQFNAMDQIIGDMMSTQSYLLQALDNLPGYTYNKD